MEAEKTFSGAPVTFAQPVRPLHWVIKVSNLKQTIDLLTNALGCRILRHEEFDSGCEASCNGPYSGYWSKSMVGFANEHTSFVFELTFNYGVSSYKRGNDLAAILMHKTNAAGVNVEEDMLVKFPDSKGQKDASGTYRLINDDILLKFVDSAATSEQLVKGIEINVVDLEEAKRYWLKLGFKQKSDAESNVFVCPSYEGIFELHLSKVESIDRGEAFGRIAFACADEDIQNVFENSGSKILNTPVVLKTEGKADVQVTILQTPDLQEICFVNETGFRDLSEETGEKVDWERYDKLTSEQTAYTKKRWEAIAKAAAAREEAKK